jgi:hypothetical protein
MSVGRSFSLNNSKILESVRTGFDFYRDMAPCKLVDSYGRSEETPPSIMRAFIRYNFAGLSQFRLDFDPWKFLVKRNGFGGRFTGVIQLSSFNIIPPALHAHAPFFHWS